MIIIITSEIIFPQKIITITQTFSYVHTTKKNEDEENFDENDEEKADEIELDTEPVFPYYQQPRIRPPIYSHIKNLFFEMRSKVNLLTKNGKHTSTKKSLEIFSDAYAGYILPNRNLSNLFGIKGKETTLGIHKGNEDNLNSRWVVKDFPVDLISGISRSLVYTDLIEYQNRCDVKAPVLILIDSGKRVGGDNSEFGNKIIF